MNRSFLSNYNSKNSIPEPDFFMVGSGLFKSPRLQL